MRGKREIIFTHSISKEKVTPEQIREVEGILAETLFREWLKEKDFLEKKQRDES